MKKKSNESKKLFITGLGFFALGAFFSTGFVIFIGIALMIAGFLPATKDEHDPV